MSYDRGATFGWGTQNRVSLTTSTWTGSMALSDPRRPDVVLVSNIAVTVEEVLVPYDTPPAVGKTDYVVKLYASPAATMDWPVGTFRGVITLRDGAAPQNVEKHEFAVIGRAG